MEDNEFEEVTIISHTDRPHRVFSEKSIEKLKEQISLEIVKEISGTEDKTYSDDPRLAPGLRELEKLKQDHFGEGEGRITAYDTRFISRVAGESGQYLLGTEFGMLFANAQGCRVIPCGRTFWNFLAYWGQYIVAVPQSTRLRIYELENMTLVKHSEASALVWPSRNVQTTPKGLYFTSDRSSLIQLDQHLKESTIPNSNAASDFFVCPKTETITMLKGSRLERLIKSNDKQVHVKGPQLPTH